jgi:hypothetical protein
MKLSNAQHAVVDQEKLTGYCLNFEHPRGRHKARVFASALGLTKDDSEELRKALLSAALSEDATPTEKDEYGQRYVLDFSMTRPAGQATIRSSWIVRRGEDFPRFTSCYVLTRRV